MEAKPEPSAPPQQKAHGYRHAGFTARQARDLVFDRLPPAVRDRLTRGVVHGAPEPLLAAPSGRAPLARSTAVAVLSIAIVATFGVATWGLGEVRSPHGFQPEAFAAIYVALLAVAALAGGAIVKLRRFLRGAPFRSGRYLFSLDLVEANGGRLRVTSLDTLRGVEAQGREVAMVFEDGHSVVFPASSAMGLPPAAVVKRVNKAIAAARALAYPADEDKLQRLDPFFEVRVTEDWDAAADTGERARSRIGLLAAIAAVAAVPAGIGLLHARNALSDDLMFDEAQIQRAGEQYVQKLAAYAAVGRRHQDEVSALLVQANKYDGTVLRRYLSRGGPLAAAADDALFELAQNDEQALAQYLRGGGRHLDEADEALFAVVRRSNSPADYTIYLERGKHHADEVRTELLPEADYAQAARSSMVGSLFSFVRRNPGSKHEDEAWRRIRKTYANALPAFESSRTLTAEGRRFAEALLAALQDRADPRVTLEVVFGEPTSVARADADLGRRYGDRYLPAADRFTAESLQDVASGIHESVRSWFARAFPHGVVEVVRPSTTDESRPRIEIRLSSVAYGSALWAPPGRDTSEPSHVTPLVGFVVEVRGTAAARDGSEITVAWKTSAADTTDGKMAVTGLNGAPRAQGAMLDDAYEGFLLSVPESVAGSFEDRL